MVSLILRLAWLSLRVLEFTQTTLVQVIHKGLALHDRFWEYTGHFWNYLNGFALDFMDGSLSACCWLTTWKRSKGNCHA